MPTPTPAIESQAQALPGVASIVLVYALFASLWIALSDAALAWLVAEPAQRALVGAFKGWAFVGVTAALLYGLVRRLVRRQEAAFAREREALQSQDRALLLLRALSDNASDVIYAKDREGRYLLRNAAGLRETGSSADQVIGHDDSGIYPAEQALQLRTHDERVMAQNRAESFEEQLDTVDGRRTFLATKGPLRDAAGRVIGMFGISRDITERHELERQREAAHAEAVAARDLLRDVLARVDDGFVALDREWRYTYLNAQAARMLGRDGPEDLIGHHIWTEFPEGVGQPFHRACERAMTTQRPAMLEDHSPPWDFWSESRIYPSPEGLSIYFSDITVRRKAEQALREREARLQVSELRYRLAAAQGQVWDWDLTSDRFEIAPESWQQLGIEPPPHGNAIRHLEELMHPEDVSRGQRALREHLAQHLPYDFEFRARHANGEWRWFHTQGQAVWDAQGRATYMAGTNFEITARKQAEDALRTAEAYQRKVFEQLADGVVLIDLGYRILDANPQALAMLGYRRDELLHLGVRDLLPEFEHQRITADLQAAMARRPDLAEWEIRREDGSQFTAEVSARPLDDGRFVLVVRDITLRRAAEKALLTSQIELSELTQRLLTQEQQTTRRIAQALHDHLGQTLAAARLNLDACITAHAASMPGALKDQIRRISTLLDGAVRDVRQVLTDLRPPLLEDQGLATALDNEIGSQVPVDGHADVLLEVADGLFGTRWPPDIEYAAFMVAREAVANAHQHAGASLIRVVLEGSEAALSLDVIDDGRGVPAPLVHGRPGHLGIVGMRERAIAIGARFKVEPVPSGGTSIMLRWEAPQR